MGNVHCKTHTFVLCENFLLMYKILLGTVIRQQGNFAIGHIRDM